MSFDTATITDHNGSCGHANRIWQTAKTRDPGSFPQWKHQAGFEYTFMNDDKADIWMKEHFKGSLIWWTWQHLPSGILVRLDRNISRTAFAQD